MLTKAGSVELLTLTTDHYEVLAWYLTSYPGEKEDLAFWKERFRFWWDENPAFSNGLARGWVLRKNGEIVGFMGNLSSLFQLSGKPVTINSGTTWRVLPDYRNYSLCLLHKQMSYSKQTLLLGTTPNDTVSRVLEMFKFQPLPRSGQKTNIFVTHFEKVLEAFLPKNQLGRLIAKVLAPVFKLIQELRLKGPGEVQGLEVREIFKADSSFDELWGRTKNRYLHTAVRTSRVINWYCFASQRFRKKLFGVYRGERLLGYAIFANSQARGLNTLECFDFWGEFEEKTILLSLINYLRQYAKKHSLDWIKFYSFSKEMARLFEGSGLFQIPLKKSREYVQAKFELETPLSEDNTYFTYLIGDIGV